MNIRRCLPNGKPISILGFGAAGIWSKPQFPDNDARKILRAAYDRGVNYFDTAPSYGWGLAEKRLGGFLKEIPEDSFVSSTKVGTVRDKNGRRRPDYSPAGMEKSFGESLARLGLERVDILYLHGASYETFTEETFRFFEREKERGRIVYSGVNSFKPEIVSRMIDSPLDCVMLQLNVNDTRVLPLLDKLKEKGKTIIAGTILAQGITNLKNFVPTNATRAWYLARALKNDPLFLTKGLRLRKILHRHGLTNSADCLRFVVSDQRITSGLFGTRSINHVIANIEAAHRILTADELELVTRDLTQR